MKEKNETLSDKILKKMSFVEDQEGIMRRYINEEGAWNEHLNRSKQFIKHCISNSIAGNVAILGSGWLLDVPIEFLVENCSNVYLFDIRHPIQIQHKLKSKSNLHFVSCDITGGAIQSVYNCLNSGDFTLDSMSVPGFSTTEPIDYIVSVNILNQLDLLIVEYLRRFTEVKTETILNLRKKIQESHIASLLPEKACLITDYEELLFDKEDKLSKTNNLLFSDFPKGKKVEDWIWYFDSQMTYYPDYKTKFKVKAIQI